jgi:hypothetical protein
MIAEVLASPNHCSEFTIPQIGTDLPDPILSFLIIRESSISDGSGIFGGMKPIHDMDGMWVMATDLVPNSPLTRTPPSEKRSYKMEVP